MNESQRETGQQGTLGLGKLILDLRQKTIVPCRSAWCPVVLCDRISSCLRLELLERMFKYLGISLPFSSQVHNSKKQTNALTWL